MKLKIFIVSFSELQEYLDKYEEKIKFITYYVQPSSGFIPNTYIVIIDVA